MGWADQFEREKSVTSNHDYNTPERGAENWDQPINKNFERLDGEVEIRDAEANLESYEPKANAKYLCTDSKKVFLGTGDSWEYLTTLGGIAGDIYVQVDEPSDAVEGDLWIKTSN